jgi:hypothetical protein
VVRDLGTGDCPHTPTASRAVQPDELVVCMSCLRALVELRAQHRPLQSRVRSPHVCQVSDTNLGQKSHLVERSSRLGGTRRVLYTFLPCKAGKYSPGGNHPTRAGDFKVLQQQSRRPSPLRASPDKKQKAPRSRSRSRHRRMEACTEGHSRTRRLP